MSKESYMIGPSGDGEHYVDYNHKCIVCGYRMPLPEREGTYCPLCGKYEPTHKERKNIALNLGRPFMCSNCGNTGNLNHNFCINCGHKLNSLKSISNDISANSTSVISKNYRDILIAEATELLEQCKLLNFEEDGECGFMGDIARITENIKHPIDVMGRIIDNLPKTEYSELV